jgi:polysaccharide pyruvyl transferase WcaK-like protein
VPAADRVGYLGWVGHRNMGDEASFEAYRRAVPGVRFVEIPSARALGPLDALTPHRLLHGGALGGGTLIGWPYFRTAFERLLAAAAGGAAFMLGTGVEDPDYHGHSRALTAALERAHGSGRAGRRLVERELELWAEPLSQLTAVAVRGPRSVEVLAAAGVEAEAVGDPALLLADTRPHDRVHPRLVGLNAGRSDGLWGGRPDAVVDAVAEVGRRMLAGGWSIRLVPLSPPDVPVLREVAGRLDGRAELVDGYLELETLRAAIRECHVFMGEKLHSLVLAAASYVPAVALEYHPKCRDFQRSLGREHLVARTDALVPASLAEQLEDLAERRDAESAQLVAAVTVLKARLERHAAAARDRLARTDPVPC